MLKKVKVQHCVLFANIGSIRIVATLVMNCLWLLNNLVIKVHKTYHGIVRYVRGYAANMITEMTLMKHNQELMAQKLKEMDRKTDKFMDHVEAKLIHTEREIADLKEQSSTGGKTSTTSNEQIQKQIAAEVNEALERQKRKNRIVINGLVNSKDTPEEVQDKVEQILYKFSLNINAVTVFEQLKDKRFISIELKDNNTKASLLKRSKELKDDPQYADVYIRPDLTYIQRMEGKQLREELKFRINNGEKNLKIIRGRLMKVFDTVPVPVSTLSQSQLME